MIKISFLVPIEFGVFQLLTRFEHFYMIVFVLLLFLTDEVQEVDSAEISSATANATAQETHSSLLVLDIDKMNTKGNSTACSESVPVAPKEDSVSMMAPLDLSASSTEMTTSKMSYLLCGRVRVYPCFPDVSFPKGITVLPISGDKWVAMSLEFPNEKGN